jgi:hypothetical protein
MIIYKNLQLTPKLIEGNLYALFPEVEREVVLILFCVAATNIEIDVVFNKESKGNAGVISIDPWYACMMKTISSFCSHKNAGTTCI